MTHSLPALVEQWRRLTHALGHDSTKPRSAYFDALDVDAVADACLAALSTPNTQPARCSALNNAPGPFQCEGKHGHVGQHWWGSMTWTDAAPAPVEPPPAKGKE
jgi:hypothetical protein